MPIPNRRTDLPVLLLHNLDPTWTETETREVVREVALLEAAMARVGHPVTSLPVSARRLGPLLRPFNPEEYVVFNICEALPGIPRSDVHVARTLDRLGFVYTGSRASVLALSWDKARSKRLLDRQRLPTPRWRVAETPDVEGWDCYPSIVKPAFEHSSFGVTNEAVVLCPAELRRRVAYVLDTYHEPALVEDFIDGREFHVTLWGDGQVEILPPAEMDFGAFEDVHDRLCTYDSKFSPGTPAYEKIQIRTPAALDEAALRELERTALAVYRVFGCRDYARLDLRLRDGVFYVLDINPNAEISSETSMTFAAEAAGYSYGDMASTLVNLAALRHPQFGASLQ